MSDRPHPEPQHSQQVEALWRRHRGRLLDVGYRILGSFSDAEDVAAEAYIRLLKADLSKIDEPLGWLVTVTGRLCIDRLRSAEQQRRAYVGPWLPEPVIGGTEPVTSIDPLDRVTLDDSVRMALLVVLEELSPAERTSFVLHDLFAVPFDEVAEIVGRSPAACRQLASRARKRIGADPERPRQSVSPEELDRIAVRFAEACGAGAVEPLLEVLDPNVVGDFDSGGAIPGAPLRAIEGASDVARILVRAFGHGSFRFTAEPVNGEPGVVVRRGDLVVAVIAFAAVGHRIEVIHAVGNPEKLSHLNRPETGR